jgi:hypothetical protein
MTALLTVLVGLGLPGLLPAIALARRSPVAIFLAPVIGAIFAAVAAELELGVGGSLFDWYLPLALVVNATVMTWWVVARASGTRLVLAPAESALPPVRRSGATAPRSRFPEWAWYAIAVATLLGALAVPLIALRGDRIGWDSNSIWLTHTLMIFGGHHELLTSLQNRTYAFSNPDYPPLVPASGALAFRFFGMGSLLLAVDTTAFLTACAVGVAGVGIVTAAREAGPLPRAVAVMTGGAFCIAGFAVSSQYGIDGHADLLWAAAAVAAIIWGLVLPRSTQALAIAWTCAVAASLTKNEGLTTALIVLVLICLRYRPLAVPRLAGRAGSRPAGRPALARWARAWAERAAFVLTPAVPGLAWAGLIHLIGIQDAFFSASSGQSLLTRAHATVSGMSMQLRIVPVALVMLVAGSLVLRRCRQSARLANPAWLWTVWLGSLATIFATYVFGDYPIQWWLQTSVSRTTIFAQVLLYADIGIWLVIAMVGASWRDPDRAGTTASPAAQPDPAGDAGAPATRSSAARL